MVTALGLVDVMKTALLEEENIAGLQCTVLKKN